MRLKILGIWNWIVFVDYGYGNENDVDNEEDNDYDNRIDNDDDDEITDKRTWHWIVLVSKVVDHWVPVQRGHVRLVAVRCFFLVLAIFCLF